MPTTKSAIKRVRKTERQSAINQRHRTRIRKSRRELVKAVEAGDFDTATASYKKFASYLDKAAKRNIAHSNKASRLKSRMSQFIKRAHAEKSESKAT